MIAERAAGIQNLGREFRVLPRDEATAELARITQLLNNGSPASAPDKEQDVSEMARADVVAWLAALGLPDVRVRACWASLGEGMEMQFSDFLRHYDDLWYPGADDVYVRDIGGRFLIFFDHEERIGVWCRTPAAVTGASHVS